MAVKQVTIITPSGDSPSAAAMPANGILWTWSLLANGDTGAPVAIGDYADLCAQFDGAFGTGGTIKLQGSNDGATWYDLTDVQAATISKTSAGLEQVAECPLWVRPNVTAGDGSTSLNCRLFGRRGRN
jgi:hypothetical protein